MEVKPNDEVVAIRHSESINQALKPCSGGARSLLPTPRHYHGGLGQLHPVQSTEYGGQPPGDERGGVRDRTGQDSTPYILSSTHGEDSGPRTRRYCSACTGTSSDCSRLMNVPSCEDALKGNDKFTYNTAREKHPDASVILHSDTSPFLRRTE